MRRQIQKKKCLQHRALIVAWLRVNYGLQASGSIAKRDVFVHYIELCRANKIQPSSAASFGKILKMAFPSVKCNRVGPRGASKHHYRGLVLRESYHLSLENVVPISDAAITEMMRTMEEAERRGGGGGSGGDDEDDDEDDDDSRDAASIKNEHTTSSPNQHHMHQQHQQHQQLLYQSSSSAPSSPPLAPNHHVNDHSQSGYLSQFMPPAPPSYSAYAPLPPPSAPAKPAAYLLPPPQQQLPYAQQHAVDLKKESFSWISPEMDPSARSTAAASGFPSQQSQSLVAANLVYREWLEKRELAEFCERNFQSLYDTVLRTSCGEGKDLVLTHIAEAWKNLRQFTRPMNLFPEPHQPQQSQAGDHHSVKPESGYGGGDYTQGDAKREGERYNHHLTHSGSDHTDELKRKATMDAGYGNMQQQMLHQPLSAYHHQMQQPQSKRPYASSSPQQAHDSPAADQYSSSQAQPAASHYAAGAAQPLLSFSGGSSSVSLSWLNSMAFSVNNGNQHRAAPTQLGTSASGYPLPAFASGADMGGNRGSLEGLEYRSFEWKGVFE